MTHLEDAETNRNGNWGRALSANLLTLIYPLHQHTALLVVSLFSLLVMAQSLSAQTNGYLYPKDLVPPAADSMPKINRSEIPIWMLPKEVQGNGWTISREILQTRLPSGVYRRYFFPDSTHLAQELFVNRERVLDSVKSYFTNGNLLGEYYFQNGIYHGPHREYFQNGGLAVTWYYQNGSHHEFKFFSLSGNVVRHCIEFKPGKRRGKRIWDNWEFYPDGTPRWEGRTINGEKVGKWKYWDVNGNLTQRREEGGRMGMYLVQ